MAGDDSLVWTAVSDALSYFFLSFFCFPPCFNAISIVEALSRMAVILLSMKCDFLGEQKAVL